MTKRAAKAATPDPKRAPDRLADGFMPALLKVECWTRSTHVNLICESKPEAEGLAKELKRRGWKAKPDVAISLQTGETVDYVYVTGPSARKRTEAAKKKAVAS